MGEWLAHEGPALLDVRVNRMELVMPPKVTPGEVVSLLRDNLLRSRYETT